MRTPDEIKKGLESCVSTEADVCDRCPYGPDCDSFEGGNLNRDALKYIQQLEAQVPKWISVEDRLPENDQMVIICGFAKESHEPVTATTYYTRNKHGLGIEGWASPWDYFFCHYDITHWMPLPEPPEEE